MARLRACVLAVALAATAGCSSETPGKPDPGPASQTRTGQAPPITSPELDLASYADRVCELLTSAQLAPFAAETPGRAGDHGSGPVCGWHTPNDTPVADITVTIQTEAKNGWEGVYERWQASTAVLSSRRRCS